MSGISPSVATSVDSIAVKADRFAALRVLDCYARNIVGDRRRDGNAEDEGLPLKLGS